MANYTFERSRYGGCAGQILVHATHLLGSSNDPTLTNFKSNIPAGYLRCDGSVQNARDYFHLSEILGVGAESRFAKSNSNLREADPAINELGQFQLPDLGSKIIIGGRGTGQYNNFLVDDGTESANPTTRVGPQVEITSNFGNTITANYIGNMRLQPSGTLNMLGNPKYDMDRETSETTLNIDNFQGHAHNAAQNYLNHTAQHEVGFTGGKDGGQRLANSGAGHELDFSQNWDGVSQHKHILGRPLSYNHNFTYSHQALDIDMSSVAATVDVDVANIDKIDALVTPFILVEYIIKF